MDGIKKILNMQQLEFFLISNGDWGLGIGDWAPIPNPQSPFKKMLI